MKSVKFEGQGTVTIVDVPVPEPGNGEVRVRTRMSAICGSEMRAYKGDGIETGNPGHEAVGIVEALGPNVNQVSIGDRVGVSAICGCGEDTCEACSDGQSTWCPRKRFYGSMHAEAFIVGQTGCLRLAGDVPDDVGVLISGDGLGVPYHTSRKLQSSDIRSVAVFGLGPIGLGNVLLQAHLGRQVIAVDLVSRRLDYARELGAAHVIDARCHDPVDRISRITRGVGVDVAIEAAGVPQTVKECFRSVKINGLVVFNGEQSSVDISPSEDFIRRDIQAVGSWFYHVAEFPAMLSLLRQGLRVKDLISHKFPIDQAGKAYETFASGAGAKVLLDMS